MFCGDITARGVVVVACICPFCLGDSDLPPQLRYQQFSNTFDLREHMSRHLANVTNWPLKCPHPRCTEYLESPAVYWQHATLGHNIHFPRKQSTLSQFEYSTEVTNLIRPDGKALPSHDIAEEQTLHETYEIEQALSRDACDTQHGIRSSKNIEQAKGRFICRNVDSNGIVCGLPCRGSYDLRRHLLTHERHACTYQGQGCSRVFKKKTALVRHLAKWHGTKPSADGPT